jgi:hypothetical protein
MASLILDERNQRFVLYEMLDIEKLCETPVFADFSKDMFDMVLSEAQKLATDEIFPILTDGDKEGCRLENGQVYVPKVFHKCYKIYCEGGWIAMSEPPEAGGQGLPVIISTSSRDWFMHNFAFVAYPGLTEGAGHLIEVYGTEEQKKGIWKRCTQASGPAPWH